MDESLASTRSKIAMFEQVNSNNTQSAPSPVRRTLVNNNANKSSESLPQRIGTPTRTPSPQPPPKVGGTPPDRQYRTKKPNGADEISSPPPGAPKKVLAKVPSGGGGMTIPVKPPTPLANNNSNVDNDQPKAQPQKSASPQAEEPTVEKKDDAGSEQPLTINSSIPSPNPNSRVGSRVRSISDGQLRKLISDNHQILQQEKCRMSKVIDEAQKRNRAIDMPEELLKKRKNIINEILSTEVSFQQDLQILTTCFLQPLREKRLIPMLEISQLFANVEIIFEYCKDLCKILEDHIGPNQEYSAVGEIFLSQVDNLVPAYSNYCSNQQTSKNTLDRLKGRKKFTKFLTEARMNPDTQSKELEAYLLTPVQRICRYPLLLSELIKVTPEDHPDLDSLTKAHSKLNHLVSVVNENSREAYNLKRMKEISEALGNQTEGFKIMMPGRRFIHEGTLTKISNTKVERERHFILFSDMIIWVRVVKDKYELRKGIIPLRFFCFKNIPDNDTFENCWEIGRNDTDQRWILCAKERKTKLLWLQYLGDVVEKLNRVSGFFRNSVAFKINTQHSNTTREQTNELLLLRDIQNKLEGVKDLVENPNRRFIREARTCADTEDRYLFLFNDRLIMTKMKAARKFTVKTDIYFADGVVVRDIADCEESLMINRIMIGPSAKNKKLRECEIIFETAEEKAGWLRDLEEFASVSSENSANDSSNNNSAFSNNNSGSPPAKPSGGYGTLTKTNPLSKSMKKLKKSNTNSDLRSSDGPVPEKKWDDDSTTDFCTNCKTLFTATNRKHHCRLCGHIYCHACSNKKATLKQIGYKKKQRVCDACFLKLGPDV